jgi:hypothetical protein
LDCGSLLPLSAMQPAASGASGGFIGLFPCQCRGARSRAALPKATAGCSSPGCFARIFDDFNLAESVTQKFICSSRKAVYSHRMKKFFAALLALLSGIVIFTPFDLPPVPFFFIDEAIALVIFTKSMGYLGIDLTRFIPFLRTKSGKPLAPQKAADVPPSKTGPTIDV